MVCSTTRWMSSESHADLHMGLDALGQPVIHGTELNLPTLERAEATFNDEQALVSDRGILNTQGIVVRDEHPLAVEAGRLANGLGIQAYFATLDLEVARE